MSYRWDANTEDKLQLPTSIMCYLTHQRGIISLLVGCARNTTPLNSTFSNIFKLAEVCLGILPHSVSHIFSKLIKAGSFIHCHANYFLLL